MGSTSEGVAYSEVLSVLIGLRNEEKVICPLAYSSMPELFLQQDSESRLATAKLMDQLGDAVCLEPPHHLFGTELEAMLCRTMFPSIEWEDNHSAVWTRVGSFVGDMYPTTDCLSDQQNLALQKAFDDITQSLTVVDMADMLGKERESQAASLRKAVTELNNGKVQPENNFDSFEDYFHSEVTGALVSHREEIVESASRICVRAGAKPALSDDEKEFAFRSFAGLVQTAYRKKRLKTEVPQLYIGAMINAAMRSDVRRKYKPNDFEDFRHASSALPYCNAFFTEGPLKHLLCSKQLKLDTAFQTTVVTGPSEALAYLSSL